LVPPETMKLPMPQNKPRLTPVTAAPADPQQTSTVRRDWSQLMVRAQDGDRVAYRQLLDSIAPYLRSLAARYLKRTSDVEDAVQDVLLTLHMVRHTYDPGRPFGPWLLAIANRRIIDRLRREMRQSMREVTLSDEHETFAAPATNIEETIGNEAVLGDALAKLPPDQRSAIEMLKLKEMSLKDAASSSGRSVTALKVATHRALKSLRRIFNQQTEPS
jgi:RNA polymerase sigma-70 factor, ECF subfamily